MHPYKETGISPKPDWFRLLAQVKKSNETALNTGMTDTFLLEHPTAIQT